MCGIAAQFSKNSRLPDKARVRAMAEDISHRGPDDEGYYFGDWFGLGFKRLSILDLSQAGHQPMFDEQKNYVIVYNGELYNFKQIRQELATKGYAFFSNSDTEVVLKSFIEWGPECLSKFVGMFAFIIVDLKKGRVFTARDHLGIKPLYMYQDEANILFASEIKSFRQFTKFSLNEDALYEQFSYRYVSDRQTIFKNIYRLSPGTYMEFDKKGVIHEKRYYDVAEGLLNPGTSKINLGSIEADLKNSIFMHTQSDVGYNIQLSGGIDSSYITAVLAKDYGQDLHTYSVTLKDYEKDESRYQNIVADLYRPKHHSFELSGTDMADNLPKATWNMDMPVVHDACVFLMLLCEHSRQHSKVILTGEGADELFGGYGRYKIPFRRKLAFQLRRIMGPQPKLVPNFWKFRTLRSLMSRDIGLDEQIDFDQGASSGLFEGLDKNIQYRQET
ncbi:MAG TPA: asparagine synthase (glutamine-hydrolyzing), partial [Nitrospirae bacterium]|nr:asparagine synthase (glutamine-hydrolyzing) [Nitrospirota bacterium]